MPWLRRLRLKKWGENTNSKMIQWYLFKRSSISTSEREISRVYTSIQISTTSTHWTTWPTHSRTTSSTKSGWSSEISKKTSNSLRLRCPMSTRASSIWSAAWKTSTWPCLFSTRSTKKLSVSKTTTSVRATAKVSRTLVNSWTLLSSTECSSTTAGSKETNSRLSSKASPKWRTSKPWFSDWLHWTRSQSRSCCRFLRTQFRITWTSCPWSTAKLEPLRSSCWWTTWSKSQGFASSL